MSAPSSDPFVSVILPTYNRAESLGRAIDSVLSQDPPPDELIVVDDGSEFDLSSVLAPYAGRIIVHRQANEGVSSARNAGARLARGTWLAFIDSDDEWTPNHMAVLYRDLKDAPKDVVAHLGDLLFQGEVFPGQGHDSSYFAAKGVDFPSAEAVRLERPVALLAKGMSLQGAAIRRETFTRLNGFDQTMRIGEDTELFGRLIGEGTLLVTGAAMAILHRLEGDTDNLMGLLHRDPLLWWTQVLLTLKPYETMDLSSDEGRMIQQFRYVCLLRLAQAEARTGRPRPWDTLFQSARAHPSPAKGWAKALALGILGKRGYGLFLNTPPLIDRS